MFPEHYGPQSAVDANRAPSFIEGESVLHRERTAAPPIQMSMPLRRTRFPILAAALLSVSCGDDNNETDPPDGDVGSVEDAEGTGSDAADDTGSDTADDAGSGACEVTQGLDPAYFADGSLAEEITVEDCTLANGDETTCYRIVVAGAPSNHELTTVCPRTITDPATGLWMVDGEGVEVDGPFIAGLAETFGDPAWQMYDEETGEVYVTETAEDCLAAGGMPLDPSYSNYCVECTLEHIGGAMTLEYLIPTSPVLATEPTEIDTLAPGMSLNGVQFEFPADIDTIESGLQIAPIDFCGGHINFNIGYHYHEAHGCIDGVAQCDDHPELIGYARDGFGIYAMATDDGVEPSDLDPCRGHTDDIRGYHYHALGTGENGLIGCLSGELVEGDGGPGGGPGGGGPGGGPPGG